MTSPEEDIKAEERVGRVKWFDPARGFGFVQAGGTGEDILLHANVLRSFGQNSVAEGARIALLVRQTPRGLQAIKVLHIEPPVVSGITLSDTGISTPEKLAALKLQPARVKWYDPVKGFGFANIFGCRGDVFLHCEILRKSGMAELEAGEAIAMRVTEGDRGLLAAQIVAWDLVPEKKESS